MVDRKERKRSIISIYLLDSILFDLKKKQIDIYSRYQKKNSCNALYIPLYMYVSDYYAGQRG